MDLISRQDVIELVKNSYYDLAESIEDTWAMVADVEKLPSAQEQTIEEMIKEIRKWINSKNRGTADYFIVDKIEEIIDGYKAGFNQQTGCD